MPRCCVPIVIDGKMVGRVCRRAVASRTCTEKDCRERAHFQCDHPITGRRRPSCDRWLCRQHATTVGKDHHYCPHHAAPGSWDWRRMMDIVHPVTGEVIARRPERHPMLERAKAAGFSIVPVTPSPEGGVVENRSS